MVKYPSVDKIVEFNALAITMFEVKKADQAELLSYSRLSNSISKCKETEGNIYRKAAVLLRELVTAHAFASGNRRTAFITTIYFVGSNGKKLNIDDKPENAKVLTGIREGYYSLDEIEEWIRNGEIREFRR